MKDKEFEDFLGKKLENISTVFSFRLSIKEARMLLDGKTIRISIKGKDFDLKPV